MEPEEENTNATTAKMKKEKAKGTGDPFEFCEICNLNHDQGLRHKYFPSHVRSLSALLSRFHQKLSDLRFFLCNPSILRPEHANLNRLWCVFCGTDIRELGSSFACSNAFYHLASSEHLKNLKDFFRRHGAGRDRVDSFRVSEADLIKWEKGCRSLKSAVSSSSEGSIGPLHGPSKDIQHELTSNNMDSFDNHSISSFNSNASHAVMPLQSLTNEGYRVCHPEVNGTTISGPVPYYAASLSEGLQVNIGLQDMHALGSVAVNLTSSQPMPLGNNGKTLVGPSLSNGVEGRRTDSREDCTMVWQKFTQISCTSEGSQANVHTGAMPPWLEANGENERNLVNKGPYMNNLAIPSAQSGKLKKLNPKRVGAAWSDKRRVELEMERRGERVPTSVDANWLPNFGRVWQAGTRKESRKEFEMEKQKFFKDENQSDLSFEIQPYISKRMRTSSDKD